MKETCLAMIILFSFLSVVNAQDIYYKYTTPDTEGKSLSFYGNNLLGLNSVDTTGKSFEVNVSGLYAQWKFNKKWLLAGYSVLQESYFSYKFGSNPSLSRNYIQAEVFGGASYYFSPNKFYTTIATQLAYYRQTYDTGTTQVGSISDYAGPGFLYGALGYGRIMNAGRISIAMDFAEKLKESGIIKTGLSQKTLLALTSLIDKRAYGDFNSKYWDEGNAMFFKQLESLFISDGVIPGPLDAANTVRLYETLMNTYGRYVNFPRYTGYQIQLQAQYQLYNNTKDKTHDHFASLGGVYGLPLSDKTQLVFSGYFAIPLDTLADEYGAYSTYLYSIPDRTNLNFFDGGYQGLGVYGGGGVQPNNKQFGLRTDLYHSISSKVGLEAHAFFINFMPRTGSTSNYYQVFGRLDYNLTNFLRSYLSAVYYKYNDGNAPTSLRGSYNVTLGLSARVF